MIIENEGSAGPGCPQAPSLDQGLWRAPPALIRERIAGIAVSVLAHMAAAGALYAALALEPSPEPPGFLEIPVEIVVEPAMLELAEPDEPPPQPSDEPAEAPRAAAEDIREEPADVDRSAPAEEALPSKEEPSTVAALDVPTEMPIASEPPSMEPAPEIVEPMDQPPSPASPRPQPTPRAGVVRPKIQSQPAPSPQPQPQRRPERKAAVRADAVRAREPAREERPAARPRTSAPAREEARENGARQAPAAARRVARAEIGPQSGEQGRAAAAVAPSPAASSYRGQVIAHLTRFKRYPMGAETRGAEGTPVVSFSLDGGGRVLAVALARSSGHADIDAETVAMVRRAVPFPAPPPGAPLAISAAISFQLR